MDITSPLHRYFGFSSFRAGQQEAIQSILTGHHTLVVMPTGAGKSLIFQLAALQLKGITLVISPLIALMKDQVDSLTRRNIPATYINSGLSAAEQNLRLESLSQNKYRLVYVAPERLRNVAFMNAIRTQQISLLAVDEAHCISEWGHDFRPDYLHIKRARASMGNPLTAALTATATPQVQTDILRLLELGDAIRIVTGFNRSNLTLDVKYVSGLASKLRMLGELLHPCKLDCRSRPQGAVIIYTGTRRDAEEVTEFVREVAKIPAEFYHAGLLPEERARIQNDFIGGKLGVICATSAFGMGIDRADVRQVIHYSIPGSLEAYYQEAGRAGRDGEPARVTLLYDPEDRALQEFFINSSVLAENDLRLIHRSLHSGEPVWTTTDELSRFTGLHPVQIRVGLSELERAGALEHLGDEGFRMLFRKLGWDPVEVGKALLHAREHFRHRQMQLDGIVHYAESDTCRRKTILDHFGDRGQAEAADCCDNCRAITPSTGVRKTETERTPSERAALVILDSIRRAHVKVGREKLAQILHGSRAKDILIFHHDKNMYYGKLAILRKNEIVGLIDQLIQMGYIKVIGGEYRILSLTSRGDQALKNKEAIPLASLDAAKIQQARDRLEAGGTVEYTAKLLAGGMKPEQIAHERGLALETIYGHCAQLISRSRLEPSQVIPADIQAQIEEAIQKAGAPNSLTPIKMLLPDRISYEMIRCVVNACQPLKSNLQAQCDSSHDSSSKEQLARDLRPTISVERVVELGETNPPGAVSELIQALESPRVNVRRLAASALGKIRDARAVEPLLKLLDCEKRAQVRQYAVKALGAIGDKRAERRLQEIAKNEEEMYYTRDSAKNALKQLDRTTTSFTIVEPVKNQGQTAGYTPSPGSSIESFLSKPHPRPLIGPWHTGWSLGFHSRFTGGNWIRSGVGDLTYRLKYESDTTVLPALLQQTLSIFAAQYDMSQVDLLIPVPSSTDRKVDPVRVFCEALAVKIKIPMKVCVVKTRQSQPQKEMKTLAQKRSNVAGAFALCGNIHGKRLLLVDDLFDSGATLEEITRLLLKRGATHVNVLTLTRTIHSDN